MLARKSDEVETTFVHLINALYKWISHSRININALTISSRTRLESKVEMTFGNCKSGKKKRVCNQRKWRKVNRDRFKSNAMRKIQYDSIYIFAMGITQSSADINWTGNELCERLGRYPSSEMKHSWKDFLKKNQWTLNGNKRANNASNRDMEEENESLLESH